jgi:hypothetical protein
VYQGSRSVSNVDFNRPCGPSRISMPRTSAPDIGEVIREALAVSAPDDREDIRTLQCVLDERDRTIAAHEETIRHLRSLLADERRRMAEERRRLLSMLTERRRWWWRWFR